jgi:RNA polymerase sigma factor (sigma-70 family)
MPGPATNTTASARQGFTPSRDPPAMNAKSHSFNPAGDNGRRNGEPPLAECTDKELFLQVQRAADERAFEILYDRHAPCARKQAARCLNHSVNHSYVEDIVQEVFLQVWRKRSRITCANLPGLVGRIARCKAISLIRKHKPCALCDPADFDKLAAQPSPGCFMDWVELLAEMAPGVSPKELLLLEARFVQGQTYAEVARNQGITIKAAQDRVYAAIKKFKKMKTFSGVLPDSCD